MLNLRCVFLVPYHCAKCAQCGFIVVCVAAADNCSTNLQDRLVQERLYTSQIQTEG
jgi:hypothetical protein